MGRLSIVIPTLNEEQHIGACLESVHTLDAEVIVADGGSSDATGTIARRHGARLIHAPRGRGSQLRAGAAAAGGDAILFIHADCVLAESGARAVMSAIVDPSFTIGTLRLRLAGRHPLYNLYSWFTRFDSIWTSFGDQGIVIRRGLYDRLGGFPDWPLLEDVKLLREARRTAKINSLPGEMITSARRFERVGIARQQFRNGGIIIRYLLGTSPESLARDYADEPALETAISPGPATAAHNSLVGSPRWHEA
jgi:rSAM/selenodomain-associated transferase 2